MKKGSQEVSPTTLQSAENLWKRLAAMRSFIADFPAALALHPYSMWNQVPEPWASSRRSPYAMHSSSVQASRLRAETRPQTDFFFHPWRTTEGAAWEDVIRPRPNGTDLLREKLLPWMISLWTPCSPPWSDCELVPSLFLNQAPRPWAGKLTRPVCLHLPEPKLKWLCGHYIL